ncbi:IS3 family transposase [Paenibacillus dokdonensis]|uniref:IS3 family transposase n=1 Tax=Paenibacillus dokdonensis TaxID=2567944 RepID=UPI003CCC8641
MESIRGEVSVKLDCELLGIARSSYYRWKAALITKREDLLTEEIRQLCTRHKFRYGYRKITALLRKGQSINHKSQTSVANYAT